MKDNKTTDIKLNDKQQEIFDAIINKIDNYPGMYTCTIEGYAGTGKSTLVAQLAKRISHGYSISLTSPTHKANSVLRGMMETARVKASQYTVGTIHSFLGLKLVNEKNRQVLKLDPRAANKNLMVDVLIIDECSMISTELFEYIMEQAYRVRRALIFIGDSAQLPPVETEGTQASNLSPSFDITEKYQLTEVLRQAMDNPIISVATSIRQCIGTQNDPLPFLTRITDNGNIVHVPDEEVFLSTYFAHVEANSVSQLYQNVTDNKVLAYTNKRVQEVNMYVRYNLFPDAEDEFVPGEPIVVESRTENCPYMVQEMISCPELTREMFMGIQCWQLRTTDGDYMLAVGPHSRIAFENMLEKLVRDINLKNVENPLTKRPYTWQDYYAIKERVNILNYPYATTTHKSQGSTFDNIWLDIDFIRNIQDNDTKCRILYTAMTRPRFNIMYQ